MAQIGALSGTPGRFGDLAAEDQENHSVTIAATLGDFTAANPSAAALIAEEIKQRRPFAKELAANIRGTPGLYQAFDQSTAGQGILRALDKRGLDYIPRENSIHF